MQAHTAMFLSPSYRSAAGCHRNGPIVAKWGMLMQSSILPAAVGPPSHPSLLSVHSTHTGDGLFTRSGWDLFNDSLSHVHSALSSILFFNFCALK